MRNFSKILTLCSLLSFFACNNITPSQNNDEHLSQAGSLIQEVRKTELNEQHVNRKLRSFASEKDRSFHINEQDRETGMTALMYVARSKDSNAKNILLKLISAGADVNAKDKKGYSPLMYALGADQQENAKVLINAGANVNAKDNEGKTALIWSVILGRKDNIEALLEKKADVNVKDNEGRTALIWSVAKKNSKKDITKLLLKKKAAVNAKDNKGKTALMWSIKLNKKDITKLLLKKKAKLPEDKDEEICDFDSHAYEEFLTLKEKARKKSSLWARFLSFFRIRI